MYFEVLLDIDAHRSTDYASWENVCWSEKYCMGELYTVMFVVAPIFP